MDYTYWLIFFSAAFALSISPGPDLLYIISRASTGGFKTGIMASAGVCTGAFVHVFAAALGISAILAASAAAFTFIKIAGAIYLLYLGITALFSKSETKKEKRAADVSIWKAYKQGALIDILNPKVSIFFMAFLPQFVRPEMGSAAGQLIWLGFLVILTGFIVEAAVVTATSFAVKMFAGNSRYGKLLDKLQGTVLIGLGIRLALAARN